MPPLSQWIEWKDVCALARCSTETHTALETFAHNRFRHYAQIHLHLTNLDDPFPATPCARDCWHLFETMARVRNTRAGKAYKQWIFDRAFIPSQALRAVEAGISLIMRDVVREVLRTEFSQRNVIVPRQENAAPAMDGRQPDLTDLLPSESNTLTSVTENEQWTLATCVAESFLTDAPHRQRVALLAQTQGLSLARPEVLQAARCGKSTLNQSLHSALEALARLVSARLNGEPTSSQATVAIMALHVLNTRVVQWGKSEKDLAFFFNIAVDIPRAAAPQPAEADRDPPTGILGRNTVRGARRQEVH